MRKNMGLLLVALLTLLSVAVAAGPSAAENQPAKSPKGKVFLGMSGDDPWVVYIGEGPNPVPVTLIEYDSTFCTNGDGTPRPATRTGLATITDPDQDGKRRVDGTARLVCANDTHKTIEVVGLGFIYDTNDGTLLAPGFEPVTLKRICNGKEVPGFNTIIGTPKADVLNGTAGMDIIDGRGGKDMIKAKKGDDIVCAGSGADVVYGGGGVDLLLGQDGRDKMYGDGDKDIMFGGGNSDKQSRELLNGGSGWDVIFGWQGRDNLKGKGGEDYLYGGAKSDKMDGGGGNDSCFDPGGKTFVSCETTG